MESIDKKNILIQVLVGPKQYTNKRIHKISSLLAQKYCEKYNIEYYLHKTKKRKYPNPTWEKLIVFEPQFQKYEKVMILDTDIMIRPNSPNIFEIPFKSILGIDPFHRYKTGKELPLKTYLPNGGNIIYSQQFLHDTKPFLKQTVHKAHPHDMDEIILRRLVKQITNHQTFTCMDWNWNWLMQYYSNQLPQDVYFIHYDSSNIYYYKNNNRKNCLNTKRTLFHIKDWKRVYKRWKV